MYIVQSIFLDNICMNQPRRSPLKVYKHFVHSPLQFERCKRPFDSRNVKSDHPPHISTRIFKNVRLASEVMKLTL